MTTGGNEGPRVQRFATGSAAGLSGSGRGSARASWSVRIPGKPRARVAAGGRDSLPPAAPGPPDVLCSPAWPGGGSITQPGIFRERWPRGWDSDLGLRLPSCLPRSWPGGGLGSRLGGDRRGRRARRPGSEEPRGDSAGAGEMEPDAWARGAVELSGALLFGLGRGVGLQEMLSSYTSPAVSQSDLAPGKYPRVGRKGQHVSSGPFSRSHPFLFPSFSHLSRSCSLCSVYPFSHFSQSIFLFQFLPISVSTQFLSISLFLLSSVC